MDIKQFWNKLTDREWSGSRPDFSLKQVLSGRVLTGGFLRRQYGLIILIVLMILFYIDNDYRYQRQQAQIISLQKELKDARYESLTTSAELMVMTRESNIIRMLQDRGIKLNVNTEPPIRIE